MLRALYNALWVPALPIALRIAARSNPADRRERLGHITLAPEADHGGMRIWLHAASVGEIEAIRPVAIGLMRDIPGSCLVVTTMTVAGREAARKRVPGAQAYALAPLDFPWLVRRFLTAIRPSLVVIAETELWPNYFIESRRFGAKVAVLNGRISARSLHRYRWARPLFAEALGNADLIMAQSADDARRYEWLGGSRDRITVTGNTKYDLEASRADVPLRPELEAFAAGKPVLVAGSTARGEEEIVLQAYLKLLRNFPDLALVLAPRHLNRLPEVQKAIEDAGLPYLNATAPEPGEGAALPGVLILDTMGELRALYRRAAVAFVGGSMSPGRGGQSLAEPAACSVPVLFGPFHETQQPIAAALISAGGAQIVRDSSEIERACARLLGNESARITAGNAARATLEGLASAVGPALMRLKTLAAGA
jgi:3-deoxy-D-manno-octulosonic-acid transferase